MFSQILVGETNARSVIEKLQKSAKITTFRIAHHGQVLVFWVFTVLLRMRSRLTWYTGFAKITGVWRVLKMHFRKKNCSFCHMTKVAILLHIWCIFGTLFLAILGRDAFLFFLTFLGCQFSGNLFREVNFSG